MKNFSNVVSDNLSEMLDVVFPNEVVVVESARGSKYSCSVVVWINDFRLMTTIFAHDLMETTTLKRRVLQIVTEYASFQLTK